ncbi:MAG: FHA domain-containing protein [Alphaproteobacteria bacterium]|nr:FHA domain-containing protein [Alphaproteobacteria bacterium]
MRAHAVVRCPLGNEVELGPGAVIGRLPGAALRVDDPRVSEAHALVSLRGRDLKLLPLRGRIAHGGRQVPEVVLEPGQDVFLAPGLAVRIVDVTLPGEVLALAGDGLPRQVLSGVCSLSLRPARLEPRFDPDADAWLWGEGEGWTLRTREGLERTLAPGDAVEIGGQRFVAEAVPLGGAAGASTRGTVGLAAPVRVVAHYDTVEIHPTTGPAVLLSGVMARLVSELVLLGGPVAWQTLASEVWGEGTSEMLRHRLDVTLSRIRARLRRGGVRSDLVASDGAGCVALFLGPDDVVEDRT